MQCFLDFSASALLPWGHPALQMSLFASHPSKLKYLAPQRQNSSRTYNYAKENVFYSSALFSRVLNQYVLADSSYAALFTLSISAAP